MGSSRFQDWWVRIERDCLRHRRPVETQLDLHAVTRQECDVVLLLACETVVRRGYPVLPRRDRGEGKSSFVIRVRLALGAGIDVGDRDAGTGEDIAVDVTDTSPD